MKRVCVVLLVVCIISGVSGDISYAVDNVCGEKLKTNKEFLCDVYGLVNDDAVFNIVMIGTMTGLIIKANGMTHKEKLVLYERLLRRLR